MHDGLVVPDLPERNQPAIRSTNAGRRSAKSLTMKPRRVSLLVTTRPGSADRAGAGGVVGRDRPAQRRPALLPQRTDRGLQLLPADVVEVDVDAVGRDRRQLRRAPGPRGSRRRRRSRTSRSAPRPCPADPAEPTTRPAPRSRAICPTALPTAPAAPDTNTSSPARTAAIGGSPTYAVSPVTPRTPRYADTGAQIRVDPRGTPRLGPCVRPASPARAAPGRPAARRRPSRPPARPRRRSSSRRARTAGRRTPTSFIRPRMYGSTDRNVLAHPDLPVAQGRQLHADGAEVLGHRPALRPADELDLGAGAAAHRPSLAAGLTRR